MVVFYSTIFSQLKNVHVMLVLRVLRGFVLTGTSQRKLRANVHTCESEVFKNIKI